MRRALSLSIAIGLAAAAFAWQRQTVRQFQQDGKTVSTNLRVVDGTLMVSAKDVASYLGGDLVVANGTATVVAKKDPSSENGGRPSLNGQSKAFGNLGSPTFLPDEKRPDPKEISVKLGEDADNDGFVLTVTSVEEPKRAYKTSLDPRGRRIEPQLPDDRLVVVRMRLENRTDATRRPPIPSVLNVTLFDQGGVGVPPVAFDARPIVSADLISDLAPYDDLEAPILAPKGAFEFDVVFSLSKGRTPSRLTVALPAASTDKGGSNVNVSLK